MFEKQDCTCYNILWRKTTEARLLCMNYFYILFWVSVISVSAEEICFCYLYLGNELKISDIKLTFTQYKLFSCNYF